MPRSSSVGLRQIWTPSNSPDLRAGGGVRENKVPALPGRLKVAPYEVRGRVTKMDSVPEGTAEFSLGSLPGRDLLPVAGDKSSVVPAGLNSCPTNPTQDGRPGLLSCRPSRDSFRLRSLSPDGSGFAQPSAARNDLVYSSYEPK